MSERRDSGILDTCTYIDLYELEPVSLPKVPELTAITLAELHQGVAMAKDPIARAERSERLGVAIVEFDPLPFDDNAATRYGTLVALALASKRDPRPRKMDLMIAAIASSRALPLFTRNSADFRGLESMVEIVPV
ncbi:type II toxin-antitoxin system VapC family toxin [Nocardia vulneris]|uniref:Twitching motility protein PilT n=1 Tax=Nocardia vulneris TaxID=1141657 RepID=A0ABR4ZA12_9NOCA|nr:type II toxin-antitoxin system VapC family toxin [Nocardia vulneris]KIA61864.1 twitching motility protein PilT [Nocardia vulneris]